MAQVAPVRVVHYTEIKPVNIRRAVRASGLPANTISLRAGLYGQFVSRLCRGLIQEIDEDTFHAVADAMVGEGDFKGATREDVEKVMDGRASFELRPVADDGAQDQNARLSDPRGTTPPWTSSPTHSRADELIAA